ncbi:MAG: AbrB/MazE/SpoVT family DNA-binding domain-containing protein [Candidatus Latescibacteria bacterium]|nr:AbrB/MazE/SpoVT family DNA-binding domain-containing protein [Candidatus Latescibacterota bacterium]
MSGLSMTRMSTKGQVVIPESIRKRLRLKAGSQFIVMGDQDVVILKTIIPPSLDEFDALISRAREQAKRAGMKRSDIPAALDRVRGRK